MLRTLTGLSVLAAMSACAPADPPMVEPLPEQANAFGIEIAHLPVKVDGIGARRVLSYPAQSCRPYLVRAIVDSGFAPPEGLEMPQAADDVFWEFDNPPWFENAATGARIKLQDGGIFHVVRAVEGAPDGVSITLPELTSRDQDCREEVRTRYYDDIGTEKSGTLIGLGTINEQIEGECEENCILRFSKP